MSLDVVKALLIVLVVLGHSARAGACSNVMNGIAFGQSDAARYIKSKRSFNIVYTIEDNIYKRSEVQLQIEDIKPMEI